MAEKADKLKVSDVFPDAHLNYVKTLLGYKQLEDTRILTELRQELAKDVFAIPKKIGPTLEKGDPNEIVMEVTLILGGRRDALSHALKSALPALRRELAQQGFNMLDIIAAQLVAQGVLDLE